ncbi:MAG TPA: hypothetical protein VE988_08740 [Gemmataceae bacterium]|nr:hypothetical protein [Gemmataceae bacterium]
MSVWRQDSEKGPWFNVNLSRSYKNAEGSWQTSTSFGVRDLLEVAKLCDMAHTYIYGVLASEHTENAQDRNEPVEVEVPS